MTSRESCTITGASHFRSNGTTSCNFFPDSLFVAIIHVHYAIMRTYEAGGVGGGGGGGGGGG